MSKFITTVQLEIHNQKISVSDTQYSLTKLRHIMEGLKEKYNDIEIKELFDIRVIIQSDDYVIHYNKAYFKYPYKLKTIYINDSIIDKVNLVDTKNKQYKITDLILKMNALGISELDSPYFDNITIAACNKIPMLEITGDENMNYNYKISFKT